MSDIQTIITVNTWERKLAVEAERSQAHPNEPYVNYLAPLQSNRKDRQHPASRLIDQLRVMRQSMASRQTLRPVLREWSWK